MSTYSSFASKVLLRNIGLKKKILSDFSCIIIKTFFTKKNLSLDKITLKILNNWKLSFLFVKGYLYSVRGVFDRTIPGPTLIKHSEGSNRIKPKGIKNGRLDLRAASSVRRASGQPDVDFRSNERAWFKCLFTLFERSISFQGTAVGNARHFCVYIAHPLTPLSPPPLSPSPIPDWKGKHGLETNLLLA